MSASPRSLILGSQLKLGEKEAFEEVRQALIAESGNVYRACERLEVPHRTFMRWRETIKGLEKVVQECRKAPRKK
jgi:hypothetical protein